MSEETKAGAGTGAPNSQDLEAVNAAAAATNDEIAKQAKAEAKAKAEAERKADAEPQKKAKAEAKAKADAAAKAEAEAKAEANSVSVDAGTKELKFSTFKMKGKKYRFKQANGGIIIIQGEDHTPELLLTPAKQELLEFLVEKHIGLFDEVFE